jgi:hypothetical protein
VVVAVDAGAVEVVAVDAGAAVDVGALVVVDGTAVLVVGTFVDRHKHIADELQFPVFDIFSLNFNCEPS